jgi:Uma2 family endonuclease
MKMVILDPSLRKALIRKRRLTGADRFDEVWNGVYVMSPLADNVHQQLAFELPFAIRKAMGEDSPGIVYPGVNVSDQEENWKYNYRCPDVAVFLPGNPAQDRVTHWLGGPDFAVEISSPYDRSRKKGDFYAKVGVRELLVVDRKPWALELFRLSDGVLESVGRSLPQTSDVLVSKVLPVCFRLLPGGPRPRIEVKRADCAGTWSV